MSKARTSSLIELSIQLLLWLYIFLSPLFLHPHEVVDWEYVALRTLLSILVCFCFYLNYVYLIPLFFWKKRYRLFVVCNLILIFALPYVVEFALHDHWFTSLGKQLNGLRSTDFEGEISKSWGHTQKTSSLFHITYYLRNVLALALAWAAAMALRLALRWRSTEQIRNEAELLRTEAELLNLKHQLSPHFLLNTLNNIYALVGFAPEQAQNAVLELSKMLRYQLYENFGTRVPLDKEVAFLHNYIALMRLRLSEAVVVDTDFDFATHENTPVAAHIFISLVENAFKHGVSPTAASHIRIALHCTERELVFCVRNSHFPKTANDKAVGGLGLQQVRRQLEISYPGTHQFRYGYQSQTDEFESEIRIQI